MTNVPFVPPQFPAGYPPAEDLRSAAAREYPELAPNSETSRLLAEQQQQLDQVTPLTAAEIAELRELRRERAERTARDVAAAAAAAARLSPPSHYVHLADGSVVMGSQLGTHHTVGDGTGHADGDRVLAVAACYPK